jgi:hypothetical protein
VSIFWKRVTAIILGQTDLLIKACENGERHPQQSVLIKRKKDTFILTKIYGKKYKI